VAIYNQEKTMKRKTRNLAARSPLMRKGGVHQTSKSPRRTAGRVDLDEAYDEWLEERRLEATPRGQRKDDGGTPQGGRRFFAPRYPRSPW
jgi:hypothetical protein